jgi:hypothetical protein
MSETAAMLKGVVRGKTIELEQESGLPDGQDVLVRVEPVPATAQMHPGWAEAKRQLDELRDEFKGLPPGEGLRRAFGAWADQSDEVDRFVEENYRLRLIDRPATDP